MKKNFVIKDGVLFEFSGEVLDLRGDCNLVSVEFQTGVSPCVRMHWGIQGSNQQIQILFSSVEDFIVIGRDPEYPPESGTMLKVAGFSSGTSGVDEGEFYVEPTQEMNYMSFVMDDISSFLVKADSISIRRL